MPNIPLRASVGNNGVNSPEDVRAVKSRLNALGFNWIRGDDAIDPETIETIRLFQAIKNGHETVGQPINDGRIDVNGSLHQWLQAANAPRWQLLQEWSPDQGFVKAIDGDQHDFGTNWLADTIVAAAAVYRSSHLPMHPKAARLTINDMSLPKGGPTPDHEGHETGLMCDMKLPRTDGQTGGITFKSPPYDRAAMRAMLKALRLQPLLDRVLFNDPVLIAERLCIAHTGHDNHAHIKIAPPVKK